MKANSSKFLKAVAMAGCLFVQAAFAATTVSIGDTTSQPGTNVLIPVRLSGGANVVAAQFDLIYPTTNLTSSAAVSGAASTTHTVRSAESGSGLRRVVIYSSANAVLGNDVLAYVPLTISMGTSPGRIALSLTNVVLAAANGTAVAASTVGGNLTITASNSPPTLDPIANQVIDANSALVLTNFAHAAVLPGQKLQFSLLSAPDGAYVENISPTNALFVWQPRCDQGGTTNTITIQVSDNGTPPLMATQSFAVTVPDCVQVSFGNVVVRAGDSVSVPVELLSTVQLSNIVVFATYPAERFTNFTLLINTQQVAAAPLFSLPGAGLLDVGLDLQTNHALRVSTNVATLGVTAVSNQRSAFVWIQLPAVDATRLDGTIVTNSYGLSGRIVVVSEEPLMEALRAPSNQVRLIQYAITNSAMQVQYTTNVLAGIWQSYVQNTQTNLVQESGIFAPTAPALFFRAIRGTNGP